MKKIARFNIYLLLIFIALGVSAELLRHHYQVASGSGAESAFCVLSETFDCNKVAESKYSSVFGVPVAGIALIYYLGLLGLTLSARLSKSTSSALFAETMLFLTAMSLAPSAYLLFISITKIKALCIFCLALDVINVLLVVCAATSPDRKGSFWVPCSALMFSAAITSLPMAIASPGGSSGANSLEATKEKMEQVISAWENGQLVRINVRLEGELEDSDFFLGSATGPVEIVEFSDFECPYCAKAGVILKKIVAQYPESVRVVFKNFPIDHQCNRAISKPKHLYACKAAAMARCAAIVSGDREMFWKMHDLIFAAGDLSESVLEELPLTLGLNVPAFSSCIESSAVKDRLAEDVSQALHLRLGGTPSIFLNGRRVQFSRGLSMEATLGLVVKRALELADSPKGEVEEAPGS